MQNSQINAQFFSYRSEIYSPRSDYINERVRAMLRWKAQAADHNSYCIL